MGFSVSNVEITNLIAFYIHCLIVLEAYAITFLLSLDIDIMSG